MMFYIALDGSTEKNLCAPDQEREEQERGQQDMLTRIQLENFRCFFDAAELSLCGETNGQRAAAERTGPGTKVGRGGDPLPAAVLAIYGPAGSGKTSLLAGIRAAWQQADPWMEERLRLLKPADGFAFSENGAHLPCRFALAYTRDGREETELSFSIQGGGVVEEKLSLRQDGTARLLYRRVGDVLKEYAGEVPETGEIPGLQAEMRENPEYLAAWLLQRTGSSLWEDALREFSRGLTCIGHGFTDSLEKEFLQREGGRAALEAVRWIVRRTQPENIDLVLDPLDPELPEEYLQTLAMSVRGLKIVHRVPDGKGGERSYHRDLAEEPDSLLAWMAIAPRLVRALQQGALVLMDDIEKTFSIDEAEKLLQLFADPITNQQGAQLLFTTSDDRYLALSKVPGFQTACIRRDARTGRAGIAAESGRSEDPNPLRRLGMQEKS